MVWTDIADERLEPGAPARSVDALALRDNPIAIADGDSGAPRVSSNAAITWGGSGTGTTNARNWILDRIADAAAGAVGTYAFLIRRSSGGISWGQTISGSNLRRAGIYYDDSDVVQIDPPLGDSVSGTWMALGDSPTNTSSDKARAMVWLRIS